MSIMYPDKIFTGTKEKTEIIQIYNEKKYEVDILNTLLGQYTTYRRITTWPFALFFNIVDKAALATYIIICK